ncbi:MAG: S8 family serine peptidase, partial [Desulfobacterales bacterium]
MPSNIETIVNPKPIQRNFIQNNNTHKILVAVIDTGIDYNHPALMNSIHFCLDINHQPIGLGWDFIGQDRWPCPYIGRRTTLSKYELDLIDNLINEAAELKTYLDKRRNVVQECLASVWHGTSMAGLIVHDCRYIGLLAYRVVPPNTIPDGSQDYALHVIENITRACRYAIEDGAKIIVMTSFLHFDKTDDHLTYMRIKKLRDQFVNLMNSHNDVLFVASAGNCNGYRYSGQDLNQIDFPAGIIAENL